MTTGAQDAAGVSPLLTVRDAAARLQVSERTLWRLIARGELAIHRVGRSVRIAPSDLGALLEGSRSVIRGI